MFSNRYTQFVVVFCIVVFMLPLATAARFLSVDPAAAAFPSMSPYVYASNNPVKYVDPNGMWTAAYDDNGHSVSVTAEEGDNLQGLYEQMGLSAEEFAAQFGIEDMSSFTVEAGATSFDITSHVISNSGFEGGASNSNCFGFAAFASGATSSENQVQGVNFLCTVGATQTQSQQTGNIAVWSYTCNIVGQGIGDLGNVSGSPAHARIFIVTNSAGQGQYLNRATQGAPVTVSTDVQVQSAYQSISRKWQEAGFLMPGIPATPTMFWR